MDDYDDEIEMLLSKNVDKHEREVFKKAIQTHKYGNCL